MRGLSHLAPVCIGTVSIVCVLSPSFQPPFFLPTNRPPLCPQDAHVLQAKQRHLQATLYESEKKAQAAMAQQAKIDELAAELEEVQQQAASAAEEQELAQSRAAVVEKAYAAAIEVRRLVWVVVVWGRKCCGGLGGGRAMRMVGRRPTATHHGGRDTATEEDSAAVACLQHLTNDTVPLPILAPLQENQALQAKQRELQAALAQSEKAARAALGQQERLESLQVRVGCCASPAWCLLHCVSCFMCWP